MRKNWRVWLATLVVTLSLGGCLPCVPGVRVDSPRTAACAAAPDGRCTELTAPPAAPRSGA